MTNQSRILFSSVIQSYDFEGIARIILVSSTFERHGACGFETIDVLILGPLQKKEFFFVGVINSWSRGNFLGWKTCDLSG